MKEYVRLDEFIEPFDGLLKDKIYEVERRDECYVYLKTNSTHEIGITYGVLKFVNPNPFEMTKIWVGKNYE